MNPQTTPSEIRRLIGPAVLLGLFQRFVPNDWNGDVAVYVANGNVVPDGELAGLLEVSRQTIANWRCRLRAAGLIGWLVMPGQGRVFWLNAVNQVLAPLAELKTEPRAVKAEALAEMPVSSGWVQ